MIEDPIYEIVRKRKLQDSFKTIVNGVSSTKRQIIENMWKTVERKASNYEV